MPYLRDYKFPIAMKKKISIVQLVLKTIVTNLICLSIYFTSSATDYYFHPVMGNDSATGKSHKNAFQSLAKIKELNLKGGDRVLLAGGTVFNETLDLSNKSGNYDNPIVISTYHLHSDELAVIDAKGYQYGILIENSSFIHIQNLKISASGLGSKAHEGKMRVGVMLRATGANYSKGIALDNLKISDIFSKTKVLNVVQKK